MSYDNFLDRKMQLGRESGVAPTFIPDFLFDFQQALVEWSVRNGRSAIFADCGLGKTPMQLVWAENIVRHTNKPVLILCPLSVSQQTVEEAEKFGIEAERSQDGCYSSKIVVSNYERLSHFDPDGFSGIVCDESSILKNFDGVRKAEITRFARRMDYRLLCTATAAPNDYTELGTSSECLGELGYMDMLSTFFKNDERNPFRPMFSGNKWRFKRHAEQAFWRWVCSWAKACRRPSDLGFDDSKFVLPELNVSEHVVPSPKRPGLLFTVPAVSLAEQREERRLTIESRCDIVAERLRSAESAVAWCQLNDEGDRLLQIIDGAEQVSGSDSDDRKEELLLAFRRGQVRVLITKPKIAGLGLNWQHCNRMTMFPSHSFESYYQSVRRCWRFGQTRTVHVDIVSSESEAGVLGNMKAKSDACDEMFGMLVQEMNHANGIARSMPFDDKEKVPSWL